jgi:transcriptional regulator with XRE-family HTH domain
MSSPPIFAGCDTAKGLSREDLAHEAGINRSYMSRLEKV